MRLYDAEAKKDMSKKLKHCSRGCCLWLLREVEGLLLPEAAALLSLVLFVCVN